MRTGLHETAVGSFDQVRAGARRRVAELGTRLAVDELGSARPTLPELSYSTCTLGGATMSAPSSDEMYARLMAIHRDACTTRRYEVSYYLLSAMLHLASETSDNARLLEIAREASKRRYWLEVHEPTHPLATRPGHPGALTCWPAWHWHGSQRVRPRTVGPARSMARRTSAAGNRRARSRFTNC
jgi:hypothetical protein